MALLDDVKSELAAFEGDSPAAIKAQAAAMIRFGGGLRPVQNTYVIQAVFTSLDVAEWLKNTLRNTFGHEAEVNHLTRQTPNGPVETYVVLVTRNVVALALQTGLVDRRKQQVRGLPSEVVTDPSPKSKRHGAAPSWPVASCPIPVRPASWKSLAPRKRPPWPCVAWPVV